MKKFLSLVLIVAMVCSLGVPAMAAEETKRDYEGHWSESSIDRWADAGLVKGDQNGNVNADQVLTRAEFATLLARLLGLKDDPNVTLPGDTSSDAWYTEAMRACVAAGILTGDQNGNLNPNAPISRAEVIVMFGRAVGVKPDEEPDFSKFADGDSVSDWAAGYLSALADLGIISGVPGEDGTLSLNDTGDMDRGSVFAMMDKAVTVYITEPGKYEVDDENAIVIINVPENARVEVSGTASNVVVTAGNQSNVYATITAESVKVDSAGYVTLEKGSEVQEVEVNAPANICNKGSLGNLVSNDSHVTYSGNKPENITAAEGTEMPTETKPTNGGGSSGGSNSGVTPADVTFGKAWDKTNNTSEGLSTNGKIEKTAKRVTVDDVQESKTVTVTTATLSAKNIVAHDNWQGKNGYWLVATFPKPDGANYLKSGVVTLSAEYSDEAFVTAADTVLDTAAYEDFSDRDGQDVLIDVAQGQVKYVVLQWQKGTMTDTATAPTYEPVGAPIYAIVQPGDVSPKVETVELAGLSDKDNGSDNLYDGDSYKYTASASFVSGVPVTTIDISAANVVKHKKADGEEGYWVGAIVKAPEGATKYKYGSKKTSMADAVKLVFGESATEIADGALDINNDKKAGYVAVLVNAGAYEYDYIKIEWYNNSTYLGTTYYILDVKDVTLKDAAAVTYTYTFKNGNTTVATMKKTVKGDMVTWDGDEFPAEPVAEEGKYFDGWYYTADERENKVTAKESLPDADTTITAKISEKTLTVKLGGIPSPLSDSSWTMLGGSTWNYHYTKTFTWTEAEDGLPTLPNCGSGVFCGWMDGQGYAVKWGTDLRKAFTNNRDTEIYICPVFYKPLSKLSMYVINSASTYAEFVSAGYTPANLEYEMASVVKYPWIAFTTSREISVPYDKDEVKNFKITANGEDITSKWGIDTIKKYSSRYINETDSMDPNAEENTLKLETNGEGKIEFEISFTYYGIKYSANCTYTAQSSDAAE